MTTPYASMAQASRAESSSAHGSTHACVSKRYDERFKILDQHTGKPWVGARYRVEWVEGTAEGVTDRHGLTERIHTGHRPHKLSVFILEDDLDFEPPEADLPTEC